MSAELGSGLGSGFGSGLGADAGAETSASSGAGHAGSTSGAGSAVTAGSMSATGAASGLAAGCGAGFSSTETGEGCSDSASVCGRSGAAVTWLSPCASCCTDCNDMSVTNAVVCSVANSGANSGTSAVACSVASSESGTGAVEAARPASRSVAGAEGAWDGTAKPGSETCCFIVPIIPCRQYEKGAGSRPVPQNFWPSA